jgi:hypothetical protein
MSFDARSRERLEALGRTLPQTLPAPIPRQPEALPAASAPTAPRHQVETEQDPQALFRALMEASPDGSVPPHLLDRLRSLEQPGRGLGAVAGGGLSASPAPGGPGRRAQPASPRQQPRPGRPAATPQRRLAGGADGEADLYDAFDDLLHNDNDDGPDPLPPPPRRDVDERLLPRPTQRNQRPG